MKISPFQLEKFNSYRIRSFANRGFIPQAEGELVKYLQEVPDAIIIGSGHNIILSREYYSEPFVVISVDHRDEGVLKFCGNRVYAYAGVSMQNLSELACERGLSGLEIFFDIPSSLGGAIVMNAGAGGEEIKDLLVRVRTFDRSTGEIRDYSKEELGYSYRTSIFQGSHRLVVLAAELCLKYGDRSSIREKMNQVMRSRWEKQPRYFPNAGSVFKRPPGFFVGKIVTDLGLRGFRIGDAQISRKHAGFILNVGRASGSDIMDIITVVRQQALESFGVNLLPEQVVI